MSNQLTEVRVLLSNHSNQFDDLLSAATLAKSLKVSLKGVFLEDEDLILASELSISSDISRWSAKEQEINSDSVQQAFRANAKHQKRELKKIAEQEDIEFDFDVVRGERNAWILDEIKINSILFVTHQNVFRNCFYDLNYSHLNRAIPVKYPVKVVFSGSNTSIKALEIAIKIGLQSKRSITVLLDIDTFENEIKLREQVNDYLDKYKNIKVNVELIKTEDQECMLSQDLYMLVYPMGSNGNNDSKLIHKLLQRLDSPLILVR